MHSGPFSHEVTRPLVPLAVRRGKRGKLKSFKSSHGGSTWARSTVLCLLLWSRAAFALQCRGSDIVEAGAVNVPLSHQSQVWQGVLLQHLDWLPPDRVLEETTLANLGWVDWGYGARKWRGSGFPPSSTFSAQCRVQALGLMARAEQVGAASSSPVIAVCLIALATTAREAAIVGVTGIRGRATGLGVVGRRHSLVRYHWWQAQKVWELQVAFV